jgi:hypothetical protein
LVQGRQRGCRRVQGHDVFKRVCMREACSREPCLKDSVVKRLIQS